MEHTYNRMTEKYGDEIGLAYENYVYSVIEGSDATGDAMLIAHLCPNLLVAQQIIEIGKQHAQQELDYSAKHQPIKRETPDMEIINIYQELNTVRLLNTYSTMREAKELLRELFIDCPIHDLSKEASYRELYITCVTSRTKDDFNARLGKLELHLFDCINH